MQIAICDDEAFFRSELADILIKYSKNMRISADIYEFQSGNDLLNSEQIFDIVFLDYQMPFLDGMETARILRSKNCICEIVFITNYPDFVFESFEVKPYRFFKKPIDHSVIYNTLDAYIRQIKLLAPIIVNTFDGQITIPSKDIIYIEGDGKYCTIRTVKDCFHSSKTLCKTLELLPQFCFQRIHKSYAINMYCISKVQNNQIFLNNGEKAIVSRNRIIEFKNAYKNFVKNYCLNL